MKSQRDEKVLRLALTYLCMKHETVLTDEPTGDELLISVAVKRLGDSLEWAEKTVADSEMRRLPTSTPTPRGTEK